METFGIDLAGKLVNLAQLHGEVLVLGVPGFRGLSRTEDATTIEVWSDAPLAAAQRLKVVTAVDSHVPQPEDGWTATEFAQAGIAMPTPWPPVTVRADPRQADFATATEGMTEAQKAAMKRLWGLGA